jgi:hypothetical protein
MGYDRMSVCDAAINEVITTRGARQDSQDKADRTLDAGHLGVWRYTCHIIEGLRLVLNLGVASVTTIASRHCSIWRRWGN